MKLQDPRDFYSGFKIDYENAVIETLVDPNGISTSLLSVWEERFKNFNQVNVCLSGGIDSQFVLSTLKKLKKEITVYIFSFVWEDCVFNAPDVIHAIRYCQRYGYDYTNIEIDYKVILEGAEFINYCKTYKTDSPQIVIQLKMLDCIKNSNPIFLGGDIPLLEMDDKANKANFISLSYQPFMTNAFLNYSIIHNKIVIKELFRMDPVTHALSYKEFINTTKKHKLIMLNSNNAYTGQSQPLRIKYYTDLGADIMPPLLKNTGFEILKMHLAKISGVYNHFDLLYRLPIKQILANEEWYKNWTDSKKAILKIHPFLKELKQEYEDFCKTTPDVNPIELYNFIL